MQIGYFLQQHALTLEEMPLSSTQAISKYEAPPLSAIRGWR
jgi:hypothetical protein